MSIWCSWETIGWEHPCVAHYDDGRKENIEGHFERGSVLTYAQGFSNHYPDRKGTHELPASLWVSSIPPWCVPGHEAGMDDWPTTGEWLQLGMAADDALTWWEKEGDEPGHVGHHSMAVVLDEDAARALRDDLTAWLERPRLTAEDGAA